MPSTNWLKLVFQAVVGWLTFYNSPRHQKKLDDADIAAKDSAISNGDVEKVNSRIQDILKVAILAAVLAFGASCAVPTRVIYVPSDQKAVPMTYQGVPGWFVPNSVFTKLLDKAEKAPQ